MEHLKDLLHFVEADGFWEDWTALGLNDEDLHALQILIMAGAKSAPVIPGTGGVRKLRFSSERWNVGKSGAVRVCFGYFPEFGIVYLIVAYSKSESDNLSPEGKKMCRRLMKEIEAYLENRKGLH
jgi:hypothetical protein